MAKTIVINGVTYNDVKKLTAPLAANPSQDAVFPETSDANLVPGAALEGYSGYAQGEKVDGNIPNRGDGSGTISGKDETVELQEGYYTGGTIGLNETEKAKLIAQNIRQGVKILDVEGTMSPSEGVKAQSKTVTPTKEQQVVQPDSGYTHLAQVTINAIPDKYIDTTGATSEADDIKKDKTAWVNGKLVTGTHTDPTFILISGVLSIK